MREQSKPDELDIDERLKRESLKLLEEMEALMRRTQILILDRAKLAAVIKEKKDGQQK